MEPQVGTPVTGPIPAGRDDKLWGLAAHLGPLVIATFSGGALGFVPPLVVMLTRGKESPFVRAHAVEALNFQITLVIALAASLVITFVTFGFGICVPIAVGIAALVFQIQASVKANNGEGYRYPVNLRLIK